MFVYVPETIPFASRPGHPPGMKFGPRLLGVDWSHIFDDANALDDRGNALPFKIRYNSGIMAIAPVWFLDAMLNSDTMKKSRADRERETMAKRVASPDVATQADADNNPAHREDFERLLGKGRISHSSMNNDLNGAAYHEASHAVVGWSVQWVVMEIDITPGHGEGHTKFYRKCDLSFRDRIAVCFAGVVGQAMFDAPTHPRAGACDHAEAAILLEGLDQTTHSAIICASKRHAAEVLEQYRTNVDRIAKHLINNPKIDGSTFIQLFLNNMPE